MIVSDGLRLAFLHIPKCAGSTVSRDLAAHDTLDDIFRAFWTPPNGGEVAMFHITLAQLEAYFPDVLEKVRTYESYAVIRDPSRRLFSSLGYYMGFVLKQPVRPDDIGRLEETLRDVSERLYASQGPLESRFVYFTRQSDYVRLHGTRVVRHLYPLEALADLAADLRTRHGITIDISSRLNPMTVADRPLVRTMKRVAGPLLPKAARANLRKALLPSREETAEAIYQRISATSLFLDLMEGYYGEDVLLYRALMPGKV